MKLISRWIFGAGVLFITTLQITACSPSSPAAAEKPKPAIIEIIEGSDFKRVTLTEKAAERLGIQTAPVRTELIDGNPRKVIPYAAVMYGLEGETWVYTNPKPLVFIRQLITVDYIEDDFAVLVDGPDLDTKVVVVGSAELYGAEVGVSK